MKNNHGNVEKIKEKRRTNIKEYNERTIKMKR